MKQLIRKVRNIKGYENLIEILGHDLGTLLYHIVDAADSEAIEELSKRTYSEEEAQRIYDAGRVYGIADVREFNGGPENENPDFNTFIATLNAEQDASLTTPK